MCLSSWRNLSVVTCCSVAGLVLLFNSGCSLKAPAHVDPQSQPSSTSKPTPVQTKTDEELLIAVQNNDLSGVEKALSGGADPNTTNQANLTVMMIASLKGNDKIVSKLLDFHVNINATNNLGDTALTLAVQFRNVSVTRLLLEHGANPALAPEGGSVLNLAIYNEDMETLRLLLDVQPALDLEAKDRVGNTALLEAATDKNLGVVEMLLKKGANVNAADKSGVTPLMKGVGNTRILELLIEHGADVNARDKDNWSPLESAMLYGCRKDIELLKKSGAQP